MFAFSFSSLFPFFEFFKIINFRGSYAKLKETNPKTNWRVSSLILPKKSSLEASAAANLEFRPLFSFTEKRKVFLFLFLPLLSAICHWRRESIKMTLISKLEDRLFSPAHPNERKREEKRFFLKEKKADLGIGGWSLGWSREGLLRVYYVVQYSISFLLLSCFHILLRFLNQVSRYGHAGLVLRWDPWMAPSCNERIGPGEKERNLPTL